MSNDPFIFIFCVLSECFKCFSFVFVYEWGLLNFPRNSRQVREGGIIVLNVNAAYNADWKGSLKYPIAALVQECQSQHEPLYHLRLPINYLISFKINTPAVLTSLGIPSAHHIPDNIACTITKYLSRPRVQFKSQPSSSSAYIHTPRSRLLIMINWCPPANPSQTKLLKTRRENAKKESTGSIYHTPSYMFRSHSERKNHKKLWKLTKFMCFMFGVFPFGFALLSLIFTVQDKPSQGVCCIRRKNEKFWKSIRTTQNRHTSRKKGRNLQ